MTGKTYIDDKGYRRFTNSNVLVHRWLAEKMLGRILREGEQVHHKNADKLDNSPSNLEVMTWQQHKGERVLKAVVFGGMASFGHENKIKDSYGLEGHPDLTNLTEFDLADLGIKKVSQTNKDKLDLEIDSIFSDKKTDKKEKGWLRGL